MPTYEYQCSTCGNRFEKFQSFNDEPLKTCPECGNEVKKVFSAAGIIFKGSGWYINDSRKTTSSSSSSSSASSDSSSTSTSSTESSPAKSESTSPAASPTSSAGESAKSSGKTEAA